MQGSFFDIVKVKFIGKTDIKTRDLKCMIEVLSQMIFRSQSSKKRLNTFERVLDGSEEYMKSIKKEIYLVFR